MLPLPRRKPRQALQQMPLLHPKLLSRLAPRRKFSTSPFEITGSGANIRISSTASATTPLFGKPAETTTTDASSAPKAAPSGFSFGAAPAGKTPTETTATPAAAPAAPAAGGLFNFTKPSAPSAAPSTGT